MQRHLRVGVVVDPETPVRKRSRKELEVVVGATGTNDMRPNMSRIFPVRA